MWLKRELEPVFACVRPLRLMYAGSKGVSSCNSKRLRENAKDTDNQDYNSGNRNGCLEVFNFRPSVASFACLRTS